MGFNLGLRFVSTCP